MNNTTIKMNNKEKISTVFSNFLKMLKRRHMIDKIDTYYNKHLDNFINEKTVIFNNKISIYVINSKISSVQNNSPLDEYLKNNIEIKKFVLIEKPTKRTVKQIMNPKLYFNCEFFFLHEFLEDIPSKNFIPKHYILTEEEKNELSKNIDINTLSRILKTDTMCRYYGAEISDVIKITRPNLTCGDSICYKIVIKGKIDNMF
jgi:DNA-directed RNA polymerase subunit H (RpoH/RPB5)